MAYADIYKLTDHDRLNNLMEISIQKKDYSGSVSKMILAGKNPAEVKYNLANRVYGTGAIINILNDFDDKFLFAKIVSEPYETYKLKIEIAGNIDFEGFLLPQTFNQDVRYKSYVALTFGNGLRMLENITPSFLTANIDDYVTETDILINLFSYLGHNYTIYINSTLYEDSMSGAEKADNPLKATYNNRLGFQKNNEDWDNALEILNKILKSINAYCYIRGERIIIERFVDKNNNPKTFWTYNPATETYSSTEEAFNEKTLDYIALSAKSFRYQVEQPVKKLKLKLNVLQFSNIFSNNFDKKIEDGASSYTLFWWVFNEYMKINNTNFSSSFITRGLDFTNEPGDDIQDFRKAHMQYQGIFTNPDDGVIFDLKYKYYGRLMPGESLDFTFLFSFFSFFNQTRYYLKTDGSIQSGLTDALLTETIKNSGSDDKYQFDISRTFDLSGLMGGAVLSGENYVGIMVYPPNKFDSDDIDPLYEELTGTITVHNGTTAVEGVNTLFETELSVGDYLAFTSGINILLVGIVSSITDNTNLVLTGVYGGANDSGLTAWRIVRVPIEGVYGDFSLNQTDIRIDNLLEANLNNDAFKTIEDTLDLYDAGYVHYRTAKLLENDPFGFKITSAWTDNINSSKSLQEHYILNRGNLFNSSCPILNLAIIDETAEVKIDDIFVFNNLKDDLGNSMKFYIDDLTYNVKQHIYKVQLKQWLADVGKNIA